MANNVDFKKFDQEIDVDGLKKDIKEVESNGGNGNREDLPDGDYEVKVKKMELVASKQGDPMVTIWFEVVNGSAKGSYIFYNQTIAQGFTMHKNKMFLASLDSGIDVEFDSFAQYGQMILDIHEAIDGKCEYLLAYGTDKKGYHTFEIKEIFDI